MVSFGTNFKATAMVLTDGPDKIDGVYVQDANNLIDTDSEAKLQKMSEDLKANGKPEIYIY